MEAAKLRNFSIFLFCASLILGVYLRLYFGVDFTDESGYVGIPFTFIHGARPFFDEAATTQNVGILIWPFIKAYTVIVGGANGLILAVRHLYFLLALGVALCTYLFMSRRLQWGHSSLIGLLCVGFIPFSIPCLSYNTVGALGILGGTVCFLQLFENSGQRSGYNWLEVFGVSFFCAAVYGYPTLVVVGIPAVMYCLVEIYLVFPNKSRWISLRLILGTSFIWVSFAVATLLYAGMANIRKIIEYYELMGVNFGGSHKIVTIIEAMVRYFPIGAIVFGCFSFVLISILKARRILGIVCLIWVFYWKSQFLVDFDPSIFPAYFLIYAGLLPVPFLINPLFRVVLDSSGRSFIEGRQLKHLQFYWSLSVIAGCVFAWTSSNGVLNASLGLLTSVVINMYLLGCLVGEKQDRKSVPLLFDGLIVVLLLSFVFCDFSYVYKDAPFKELKAKVSSGAFAGLRTTSDRNAFLVELENDLNSLKSKANSVMFFDDFPAGYLLADLPRHSHGIWTPASGPWLNFDRTKLLDYFSKGGLTPDMAVHIKSYPVAKGERFSSLSKVPDPILGFFENLPYHPVIVKSGYTIFIK